MSWEDDQKFEKEWWGDCINTFTEETKQLTYGYKMGLTCYSNNGKWPCYNLEGKSVLDIGGGPTSMLLKCENRGRSKVADPCDYPSWVVNRYTEARIAYVKIQGEELLPGKKIPGKIDKWDEVWIYNVLQHTEDPKRIIRNAKLLGKTIRIFEWLDIPAHEGHPQELKDYLLDMWLDGKGTTEWLNENGCYGRAYYGVFET